MSGKVDLVMWTKNGEKTLPHVLKRIDQVIPAQSVGNRIIVDDQSTDQTRQIAQNLGWQIVPNRGKGISDGANTALSMVRTEWFCSFEQDVLLAADWWRKVPPLLNQPEVAVASGLRFPSYPPVLTKLEEYTAQQYMSKTVGLDAEAYGKTLDNTFYKTAAIRKLGGFPKPPVPAGIDTILNQKLKQNGLTWAVDFSVRSVHLRGSLGEELRHHRSYAECVDSINKLQTGEPYPLRSLYKHFLTAPFRGLQIAIKIRAPQVIYAYPLIRFEYIKGISASRRTARQK